MLSTYASTQQDKALEGTTVLSMDSFKPAFGTVVLAGAMAAMAPAQAEENRSTTAAPAVLQEIRVMGEVPNDTYQTPSKLSSPKFTAPLLDTPRTVNVITEQQMKDRGATSLQDVLRTTPGITLGSGEGGTPVGDRPFIRGYEASTDIFIDGLRDYARGSHETFNLEAVEVIKGASSAYTGRGGTGGSINLTTKAPKLEPFAELSAGFGNADQWRTTADVNMPVGDTVAIRLNVMKMGGDVPGRGGPEIDRFGVAPSIAFGLGTPTRLTLSYSELKNKDTPDLGIPFANAANDRDTPPNVDRENFYGRLNADFRNNTMKTSTMLFEHDFSEQAQFRNITRHSESLNDYLMTRPSFDNCKANPGPPCSTEGPGLQFKRDNRARWRYNTAIQNQTDLYGTFSTGSLKHSYSAGVEFTYEKVFSRAVGGLPATDTDSFWNPDPNKPYKFNLTYGPKTQDGYIKTRSIYFMDTIELSEQFLVNVGLRRESFTVDNMKLKRKDDFWNYQLGAVYKPAENGSIYVSYATSSNPAGENLGQGGGADGVGGSASVRDMKPEKSYSWEIGTKWDVFDERLSLTGAYFETHKTDARTTDPLTGDVTLNGSNRVRGVEFGASGAITPRWNVWAGYTYLAPKIKSYRNGKNVYDGNQMKFIARHSASLWSTYKILPELTVGGGVTYLGKRYVNDDNTLELPSYMRYDAMLQYDVSKRLSLQFNANNLSNNALYDASHVGIFANVGPGRSYMFSGTYRWD